jgi:glycine cleavage system aminomethyltransferase T
VSALAFLTPDADPALARSPVERAARAAGGRFERRDGWNVAVAFAERPVERARIATSVAFADRSHLRKFELHGAFGLTPGIAERRDGAWLCPLTPSRALVLGVSKLGTVDVTCGLAALALIGPLCRELLARFCAIDVRPKVSPVGSFRPGSVARTPGYVLVEEPDRLLVMVGWALGHYLYEVVADAAERLGGGPVGTDAADA